MENDIICWRNLLLSGSEDVRFEADEGGTPGFHSTI
jgi:hypothetical protein